VVVVRLDELDNGNVDLLHLLLVLRHLVLVVDVRDALCVQVHLVGAVRTAWEPELVEVRGAQRIVQLASLVVAETECLADGDSNVLGELVLHLGDFAGVHCLLLMMEIRGGTHCTTDQVQ
jgi:hypothetical protein